MFNSAISTGDIAALYKAGDLVAPVISSIATSSLTSTGVTISWSTDENSSTQIEYGLSSTYTASTTLIDDTTYVTSHSQSLTGLTPNTTYHYRVISRDPSGTIATSTNQTFTTSAAADTTAPTISSVASSTTATTATITWNTTENASSTVSYGTTASYGSASTTGGVVSSPQSVVISGLTQGTLYHFKITSDDSSGNSSSTADYTFTTSAISDTTDPTVSISSPANGSTTAGTITVSATASDNIAVAGVHSISVQLSLAQKMSHLRIVSLLTPRPIQMVHMILLRLHATQQGILLHLV